LGLRLKRVQNFSHRFFQRDPFLFFGTIAARYTNVYAKMAHFFGGEAVDLNGAPRGGQRGAS
jgi:hypothetical protein